MFTRCSLSEFDVIYCIYILPETVKAIQNHPKHASESNRMFKMHILGISEHFDCLANAFFSL